MYLTEKDLKKLIAEGFIKGNDTRLEILGQLYASNTTVAVYGGGLCLHDTDLTFNRSGRKEKISCDLCEILEDWRFGVNGKKVKITVEVVEEG